MKILMLGDIVGGAATDTLPQNCPTTTRSAALKSSCKTLVRIMGMVNRMIFGNRGPSSMFLFVWFK